MGFSSIGQITANFEADTLQFCPPYLVQFKDLSVGSGIIYRKWIFGPNNIAQGNNKNPSASYVSSGNYNVTLIISNGVDTTTVTKLNYIKVFKNPKPVITSNSNLAGCAPLSVNFSENSIVGDAPINQYTWTFGDNSAPSNIQNPSHKYTQSGFFNVGLQVTDTNGCKGSVDSINMVEVYPKPNVAFSTTNIPHNCQTPLIVNFLNNTSGGTGNTYWWNFGNGQTSNQANPSTTYNNSGSFDVTLVATSNNGCKDTLIEPNFASATTTKADFSFPLDTICKGQTFQFNNQSVGGSQTIWNFGDGSPTSTKWEPSHAYVNSGVYNVQLITYSSVTCRDTITKPIYVIEYSSMFSMDKTSGCETPFKVQFTPDSSLLQNSNLSFYWEFGPNGANSQSSTPTYNYLNYGTFSPTLKVKSTYGRESEITLDSAIRIFEIIPAIDAPDRAGCLPLTVQFNDVSTPQDSILYRYWDFGDTAFYGPQNLSKFYNKVGVFDVFLTVGTKDSCEYVTKVEVQVGTKQTANFEIDTNLACASDSLNVLNLSTDTSLITEYQWDFGDGQSSNLFEPKIIFKDTGLMNISLIVNFNGCKDTIVKQQARRVLGPVAGFTYSVDCKNPFDIQLNGNILGGDSIFWDYGDLGKGDTNIVSPFHTFNVATDYLTKLYVKDSQNGCDYSFENTVMVRNLIAAFDRSDSLVCTPTDVKFDAIPSQDESPGSYTWLIDTAKVFSSGPWLTNTFTLKGYYPIYLIVSDDNKCKDTATAWVHAFHPEPNFSVDTFQGCVKFNPQFFDKTKTDTNLISWQWNFGNSSSSSLQNPKGFYNPNNTKWFDVSLTVTDTFGCTNSVTKKEFIRAIRPPYLLFTDPFLCTKEQSIFENSSHQPGHSYLWDFGNGSTSTANPATTQYNVGGIYDLTVFVTDSFGCADTIERKNYIQVQQKPVAQFFASPQDTSCYPAIVQFSDSTNHPNTSFSVWKFGDGSSPVQTTSNVVFNNYTRPGKYDVELFVQTSFGCKDTLNIENFITIKGPFAKINLPDDTVCAGDEVKFLLDSAQGIFETRWDFGDGNDTTIFGNVDSSFHTYLFDGRLVVRAFMVDTALKCPKFLEDTILIHKTVSNFTADNLSGCVPLKINTTENSSGADQFIWSFSGSQKFGKSASYDFTVAGDFNATLISIDSLTQCADTITKVVVVYPLPEVRTSNKHFLCLGDSVQIFARGGQEFSWTPSVSLADDKNDTIWAKPTANTIYSVLVKDARKCENTGKVEVIVQGKPTFIMSNDTSVYAGENFDIKVSSDDSLIVIHSPSSGLFCPNCLTTQGKIFGTTTYNLIISDYLGCFMIDTNITITVVDEKYLFIPNAFSPNGDGINDQFTFIADGFKRLVNFQIYDRWGAKVFETDDLTKPWDGKVNGEVILNTQMYTYLIILETYRGENVTKKGIICLVK